LALAMELPFIPIAAVVIAGGLGFLLDARLHTAPWFMLGLGFLGFLAGIREILRRLTKEGKSNGDQ
jgi:F0F1-type ATP synthase assembly protein I